MRACRQSGASLVVTLVMLVIMSLGAIGLVRSIDSSLMVAANLAFRESAVLASNAGTEAAINWLSPLVTTADLSANQVHSERHLVAHQSSSLYWPPSLSIHLSLSR